MIWQDQPVTVAAFCAVVGSHLGPLFAQAVKEAADGVYGADADERPVTFEDAGKLLETALVPLVRQGQSPPDLALKFATITTVGDRLSLDVATVVSHPLLKDWAAPRLEGWLTWQVASGALLLHVIPNMPDDYVELRDEGGRVGAEITLRFPGNVVTAVLSYGEAPVRDVLAVKVGVSGQRLRAIGADLRNLTAPTSGPWLEDPEGEDAQATSLRTPEAAAAAVLH